MNAKEGCSDYFDLITESGRGIEAEDSLRLRRLRLAGR